MFIVRRHWLSRIIEFGLCYSSYWWIPTHFGVCLCSVFNELRYFVGNLYILPKSRSVVNKYFQLIFTSCSFGALSQLTTFISYLICDSLSILFTNYFQVHFVCVSIRRCLQRQLLYHTWFKLTCQHLFRNVLCPLDQRCCLKWQLDNNNIRHRRCQQLYLINLHLSFYKLNQFDSRI